MTEWFEVRHRDGPARIGELRLDDPLTTPAVADAVLEDAGSVWTAERASPTGAADRVTMLPARGLPPGTPEQVAEAFAVDYPELDAPSGVVVDPRTARDYGADVYALSTAQGIVGHAAAFREAVVTVRDRIPDDAALYLSGVATPANVALLAWAGVDLVDLRRARIAGHRGRYLTPYGSLNLDELTERPCSCHVCTSVDTLDRDACGDHNEAVLRSELAAVRERIRAGQLRGYVSARARHTPWLMAAIREFDQDQTYVAERTPLYRNSEIDATSDDVLQRVEITRFADRVVDRYRCRFGRPLVLLPCSATKPYSQSQSHAQFRDVIQYRAHRVALSSPVGVVPQELECTYPAQHYDTPVTGRWTPTEIAFVVEYLSAYLEGAEYPQIIAHVPPGGYTDIVQQAIAELDEPVDVDWTVTDHPTTDDSLGALADALDGELAYSRRKRRHNTIRAIADYQFGAGAGDVLFPDDMAVEAPYPKHRVLDGDGTHLATMVPQYGLLALTLAGGRRWEASSVRTRRVEIDDFEPHGDVLAPGILDADDEIRVGDEVVVDGPSAYGVGRAAMHGKAMQESTRGVAVDLRHSEPA